MVEVARILADVANVAAVDEQEAVNKVQAHLSEMTSEQLGAMLSKADELRKHGPSDQERQVGGILYKQVLVALTVVHFSLVDDEPAGLCWSWDCYPETPQLVSNDISKVTCAACKEHFRTLDEIKHAQQ
jgi:hypothetical protein